MKQNLENTFGEIMKLCYLLNFSLICFPWG